MKKKDNQEKERIGAAQKTHLELKKRAAEVMKMGKALEKWTSKELKTVLMALKRKDDKLLPTRKAEQIRLVNEWRNRSDELHHICSEEI